MDFAKYLRKLDVSEKSDFQKFFMVDFYEMDFMKGIVKLVKVDEMYIIFKSASLVYWSRNEDGIG